MKIGLIQFDSNFDTKRNIDIATSLLLEGVKQRCDVLCLPEVFLYTSHDDKYFYENSPEILQFRSFAKENHTAIVLGSVLIKNDDGRNTNTCFVIDRGGKIIYRYDKIKLFKTFKEDFTFNEANTITPGKSIDVFELFGIKMGVAICYDLRFPELFREMAKKEVQLVFLPSCFRKSTGKIAWQTLPVARAIENQIFFCACSQCGGNGVKEKCGNSKIVDYEGNVLTQLCDEPGICIAEIDFEKQEEYRKRLPVLKDI